MRLLLDTHVALWAIAKTSWLSADIATLIAEPDNEIVISAVSVWEITIKHALSRGRPGDIGISGARALTLFRGAGYALLNVTPEHASAVGHLPLLHADPFDRLLVAQALSEPLRLITHDKDVAAYSDTVILF